MRAKLICSEMYAGRMIILSTGVCEPKVLYVSSLVGWGSSTVTDSSHVEPLFDYDLVEPDCCREEFRHLSQLLLGRSHVTEARAQLQVHLILRVSFHPLTTRPPHCLGHLAGD